MSNLKGDESAFGVAAGSVTYALFKHMADEHGLTLLESEMSEIVRIVNDNLDARLRWWIANAEDIAKERGELFRAGEAMRAVIVGHAWDGDEVGAWDSAAQPIRDMLSSPNTVVRDGPSAGRSL